VDRRLLGQRIGAPDRSPQLPFSAALLFPSGGQHARTGRRLTASAFMGSNLGADNGRKRFPEHAHC
jgi:hypothetical protein